MTGRATILRGDARALPLPDASVDLIVTSPPYWSLRDYRDGDASLAGQIGAETTPAAYVDALIECTREWMRVLKPTGSLWVNLGDSYSGRAAGPQGVTGQRADRASAGAVPRHTAAADAPGKSLRGLPWRYALRCIDELGLILRAEVVWSKPNGLPESVTDRVRRSHEQWFHFTVQPRYFSAVDAIREPGVGCHPHGAAAKRNPHRNDTRESSFREVFTGHPAGTLPGSVWEVATEPLHVPAELGVDHFAAFPTTWPRRIIAAWSPEAGTVLDPFGGTGTTALVARALGRHGISVDRSGDYCRLAAWRASDPGQLAKALGVPAPRRELDGQLDLLAMEASA